MWWEPEKSINNELKNWMEKGKEAAGADWNLANTSDVRQLQKRAGCEVQAVFESSFYNLLSMLNWKINFHDIYLND